MPPEVETTGVRNRLVRDTDLMLDEYAFEAAEGVRSGGGDSLGLGTSGGTGGGTGGSRLNLPTVSPNDNGFRRNMVNMYGSVCAVCCVRTRQSCFNRKSVVHGVFRCKGSRW